MSISSIKCAYNTKTILHNLYHQLSLMVNGISYMLYTPILPHVPQLPALVLPYYCTLICCDISFHLSLVPTPNFQLYLHDLEQLQNCRLNHCLKNLNNLMVGLSVLAVLVFHLPNNCHLQTLHHHYIQFDTIRSHYIFQ